MALQSTLLAMRLADRLKVDAETAIQTYYACQLFYVGCTANADVAAELFGADDALTTYAAPSRFGSRAEMTAGFLRAVAPPGGAPIVRAGQLARRPTKGRQGRSSITSLRSARWPGCSPIGSASIRQWGRCSQHVAERWDGKGEPGRARGDEIPLAMRIVHVARDAAFQRMLGGAEHAASVVRRRAGHAFDPDVVAALADEAAGILAIDTASAWDETLASEPKPHHSWRASSIDRALAAMGDFSDLVSPYFVGHSAGVADAGYERSPTLPFRHGRPSRRFGGRRLFTTSGG